MPNFIEVFAGCGGLSYGLEQAGWTPILLVDSDKNCVQTLKANKPNVKCQQISVCDLHLDLHLDSGIDLLVGGVPCQSFSHAGKRLGLDDHRGSLFHDFARLIDESCPSIFLVENVVGLLTHDKGATFEIVKHLLSRNGTYSIQYKVLDAQDYNVPQKRKRVFIVGHRFSIPFTFPKSMNSKCTLRDALANVPSSPGVEYTEYKKQIMSLIPPGGCWINLPLELQESYLGKSFTSGGGKRGMARRLHWDEPCLTLTTSPNQKQTERCHPDENRPLTTREYARIQTFPDTFSFCGSVNSIYKQIGNAVPVNLAKSIGIALLEYYNSRQER